MGCVGSKGAEVRQQARDAGQQLKEAEDIWNAGAWRPTKDLTSLNECIEKLGQAGVFFNSHRDLQDNAIQEKTEQMASLCKRISTELQGLLDKQQVVKRRDLMRIQELIGLAVQVDKVDANTQAEKKLRANKKQMEKEIAEDFFVEAGSSIKKLKGSSGDFVSDARKALKSIQDGDYFLNEVPELVPQLLELGTKFSAECVQSVSLLLESNNRSLDNLQEVVKSLDAICSKRSKGWESCAPKLLQETSSRSESVLPTRLGALEAELSKGAKISMKEVEKQFSDLTPWCRQSETGSPGVSKELQDRIISCCEQIEKRIDTTFDANLSSGNTEQLSRILEFAGKYDTACGQISFLRKEKKFKTELERKKAEVTLKDMIERGEKNINTRVKELDEACSEAKENVSKLPRAKYEALATDPAWRYKRKNGTYDNYKKEESAQVERLYQEWVTKGKPDGQRERRATIEITVDAPPRRRDSGGSVGGGRERCKYGAKCYQKKPDHRTRYCHPGDPDWDPPPAANTPDDAMVPTASGMVPTASGVTASKERLSVDFQYMTQVNEARKGMRTIQRKPGLTKIEEAVEKYYEKVQNFVQENETMFSQAEKEMRSMTEAERTQVEEQVDAILKKMTEPLHDFMKQAVSIENDKSRAVIDGVMALLGTHADKLGLKEYLKDLRMNEVILKFKKAYDPGQVGAYMRKPKKWGLLRSLTQHHLFNARWSLRQKQKAMQDVDRRRVQMLCSALIEDYAEDKDFCQRFRTDITRILERAAETAETYYQQEAFEGIVKTAKVLNCDINKIMESAGSWASKAIAGPCAKDSFSGLSRILEVLNIVTKIATAGEKSVESLVESRISALHQKMAERALQEVEVDEQMTVSVKHIAGFYARLASIKPNGAADFLYKFWQSFQPWYEAMAAHDQVAIAVGHPVVAQRAGKPAKFIPAPRKTPSSPTKKWECFKTHFKATVADTTDGKYRLTWADGHQDDQRKDKSQINLLMKTMAVEWAIAFCEQLKTSIPQWMMNMDQMEATKKLKNALESRKEKELKEAVIMAKQANYKNEELMVKLYEDCMMNLRTLKRLPSGWEVDGLIGDEADEKMYKLAPMSEGVKWLFQKFFDETKASVITRDRVGAVPGGYRVERVVSVMNAESWVSYLKRRETIAAECSKTPKVAPCPPQQWMEWSGLLQTRAQAPDILENCKVPALEMAANETLLFHGTKPEAANLIAKNHFDMSFACKTGLFGAGLYFAESCSKSDEYVQPDAQKHYPMIVARVTLGRMNYCAAPDPVKDPGKQKLEDSCLRGDYHSVLGDRKKVRGTYREFVVYDHDQVYPHFIVWYSRM